MLVETTLGKLLAAIRSDLTLTNEVKDPGKLTDRALLWLHEQEVIRLNKGLTVFRPAMTIRLQPERRGFAQADYTSLKLHYDEQVLQIHVMAEYVQQGLAAMADALRLARDYFRLAQRRFPASMAAKSRPGVFPSDHTGIVASHRREPQRTQSKEESLRTIENRRMSWCLPAPARAKHECSCIVLPT